jgi:WD40 repeat protein
MKGNFSDINKIPEFLKELYERQNELDKKIKTIEKEKNQPISELKRQIKNEIYDNLSTKLNDAEKTIKKAISKASKIEKLANNTDKTLDYLKKTIEEMQQILELKDSIKKDSIKETIKIDDSINQSKDYYLVCPNCQCRNPHIENVNIDIDQRDFNVSYYCACNILNKEPKISSLSLLINENIPANLCPIHSNKTLKTFCNICKKSFCESCEKDIYSHQEYLVNYTKMMSKEDAELMKLISEKFECQNKEIYKKIFEDYFKELKKTLWEHHDKISCLILLQSGFIATGSYDTKIRIWDLETSSCVNKIQELGNVLALLEFEPDKLISASSRNTILLWDINSYSNDNIGCFSQNCELVNCLVKCDDKTFATSSNDPYIILWDYERKIQINKVTLHEDNISALIKLNENNLCTGSYDKLIKIWDWKKEIIIKELSGHNDRVTCLCQMDDEILLSGSYDKTIKVWKNYYCIETIKIDTCSIRVLLKINNNYFAGNSEGEIIIWDMKDFSIRDRLIGHYSVVTGLIKKNNNELVSCSDTSIKIWEKNYI